MSPVFKAIPCPEFKWNPPSGYRDPYSQDGLRLLTARERHEADKRGLGVDDILAMRPQHRRRELEPA